MEIDKISAFQLKHILEKEPSSMLILDCRPFLAFNSERIAGASNVYCPSILRRRFATKGFLNLDTILSQDIRKRLKTGQYKRLVLYEMLDRDSCLERNGNSEISIIIQGLQRNNYSLKTASILKGEFFCTLFSIHFMDFFYFLIHIVLPIFLVQIVLLL